MLGQSSKSDPKSGLFARTRQITVLKYFLLFLDRECVKLSQYLLIHTLSVLSRLPVQAAI